VRGSGHAIHRPPLNELLQRLANTFARERREAGSMPVAELVRPADEAVAFVQED
jgi:2-dehydropantoate 2-reductase